MVNARGRMEFELKAWIMGFFISVLAFFTGIIPILLTVTLLVIVDTHFGLWVSRKNSVPFSKEKFLLVTAKWFVYNVILCTVYVVEKNISGEWIPGVKIIAGMISVRELASILRNASIITGEPFIKYLINKVGESDKKGTK